MTETLPTPPELDGPMIGDERALLTGYLAWQRTTLLRICGGLTGEQLIERPVPPSNLSLLGIVRHLAKVERVWFVERFGGRQLAPLWGGFHEDFAVSDASRALADVAEAQAVWDECDAVVATVDLDAEIDVHGSPMSLRFCYYHVLHEYARHNGHADLLREQVDGVTGR